MPANQQSFEFRAAAKPGQPLAGDPTLQLLVSLNVQAGAFEFEWLHASSAETAACGRLAPIEASIPGMFDLEWELQVGERTERDSCSQWPASVRALLNRLRKALPTTEEGPRVCLFTSVDIGPAKTGTAYPMHLPAGEGAWKWLAHEIQEFAKLAQAVSQLVGAESPEQKAVGAALVLARRWVNVTPAAPVQEIRSRSETAELTLRVTRNFIEGFIELQWSKPSNPSFVAKGTVCCTGRNELTWKLETEGRLGTVNSTHEPCSIRSALQRWLAQFPSRRDTFEAFSWMSHARNARPLLVAEPPFDLDESPWEWLEETIHSMAEQLGPDFSTFAPAFQDLDVLPFVDFERYQRRLERKEHKREQEEAIRLKNMARLAEERRAREQQVTAARKAIEAKRAAEAKANLKAQASSLNPAERPPLPPVAIRIELPPLELQETTFPLEDLRDYSLRERASLWWISNQSDDLLCLPHCRIKHLDYQVRTALRVLGPLRGRALLSDEVGLGKTIEAGLVLKELLTRGMVKRFLVLTVPSLVDQWEEELSDKFGLTTVTTNQPEARGDMDKFWRENTGIIASLHTLKQPAQLQIAGQVHWDILIVDEAHYLRNRESQAWQAINSLPRHFLLLLTATPVQNSLEELYNLVTLLQPGQLPSPKEFRARFIDPKRPRQPQEPEELRRLLGQVMIRNTRANAGIDLPPRRAETVLFEPEEAERVFWEGWEKEFRERLSQLNPSQASMWGRLLLQAAGSSPAAWRQCLEKFPDRAAARAWQDHAPLEGSWRRKCELLQPLTRGEGGAVIFTQFLQTQMALAEELRRAGVETFLINGATPAPERQPITEAFHRGGGALLLTHSGTEGRNLQFSHRLANFDLPWNPMEIEQRIGRLHRLGQQHPVRIYNFVQAGTLQEHLLQILQEKLNLFELVVGETGLVLGEKFSSDEFAEEVLRRWRDSEGRVAEAMAGLGEELAAARDAYGEVKKLDETLFAKDYESL